MNNGTSPRSSDRVGMNLSYMPRWRGHVWSNKSRLAASLLWPCSKVSTKPRGLGTSFVDITICILNGIGKGIVDKLAGSRRVELAVRGLSLVGGEGGEGVLGLVGWSRWWVVRGVGLVFSSYVAVCHA